MNLKLPFLNRDEKLGLALGSGAARGYAILPILRQFCDDNLKFSMASGSSAGAVVAAYYALHGEVDSLYRKIASLSKSDWLSLIDLNNPAKSLIKGKKIKSFFKEEFFGDASFSETRIPLYIAATSLRRRKTVYFYEGEILEAIMASVAIPGVFQPYEIDHEHYMDGGIKADLPYQVLLQKGAERVVGVSLARVSSSKDVKVDSAVQVLLNAFQMMREDDALSPELRQKVYLFEPEFLRNVGDSFKFYLVKENYKAGENCLEHQYRDFLNWLR